MFVRHRVSPRAAAACATFVVLGSVIFAKPQPGSAVAAGRPATPARSTHGDVHKLAFEYQRQREGPYRPHGKGKGSPLVRALRQQRMLASTSTVGGSWTPLGPAPINTNGLYNINYATGRVIALAYVKATGTLYAGGAQGGVWKTTNGGNSWAPLTDSLASQAIGALAVDPSNNNVIYAGTGEMAQGSIAEYGIGIYKSTDGGTTWTLYGNDIFQDQAISALAVDPTNSNNVYAAVVGKGDIGNAGYLGVAVSTDGGQNWSEPSNTALTFHNVSDLTVDKAGNLWAAAADMGSGSTGLGVYFSSDHGVTWTSKSSGLPTSGDVYKIDLAPQTAGNAPGNQTLVAMVSALGGALLGVYRTTNGGSSWTQIGTSSSVGYTGNAAWYDPYIVVDPNDSTGNTIYVEVTDTYKTTNGGASWCNLTNVYNNASNPCSTTPAAIHPDHHILLFVGTTMYFGTDGGVYISSNGGSTFSNGNGTAPTALNITQFYAGALGSGPNVSSLILAGSQDNGTDQTSNATATNPTWNEVYGGDGFYTAIDPTNNSTMYTEYVNGDTLKETATTGWIDTSSSSWPDNAQFSAPLVMDPNNASTLYSAHQHLWKSTNAEATWTNISSSVNSTDNSGNPLGLSAVAVAKTNSNTIYIANSVGHSWMTSSGGGTWASTDGDPNTVCVPSDSSPYYCPWTGSGITGLAGDPTNSQIVYATVNTFQGAQRDHVFKSTNGGATWTDLSSSLPDVPFQSVVVKPNAPSTIYVGSDIGVYVSTDGGSTWSVLGTGLPTASVYQLVPSPDGSYLTAFTFGRGAWRIATP